MEFVAGERDEATALSAVVDELGRLFDAGEKDRLLGAIESVLGSALAENRMLSAKVVELTKKVYGRSSERVDPNQLRLALDEMRREQQPPTTTDPEADLPSAPPEPPKERKKSSGRRNLPADLPREEIRLTPMPAGEMTSAEMTKVGEERSEVLEYEPARFKVLVYVRETWSNSCGEIATAPAPNKIIEKGLPGPGLLAQVAVAKYKDHLPLNRQTKIYARDGVSLHRNTLVDWIAAICHLLEPVANRIHELAMLAQVLQVDDTRLDVLDRSKRKNIKRAHLWVLLGDEKYISFKYTPDWKASRAEEFLGERIGWMQVDGYKGYISIARDRPILLVGCWMHARRPFVKALEAKDARAAEPLELIKKMYAVEAASREAEEDADARLARRERDLTPLLDELECWLDEHEPRVPPRSSLGKAIGYARQHWDILRVVEKDGMLALDNGDVERVIRGPAVGRKNWLFAGADTGGHRAAIILTVLETAARAGLDVREYLRDILVKLSSGWKQARLDELLPEHWVPGAISN